MTVEVSSTILNLCWWMPEAGVCGHVIEIFRSEFKVKNVGFCADTDSAIIWCESSWTEPVTDVSGWVSNKSYVTNTLSFSAQGGVWTARAAFVRSWSYTVKTGHVTFFTL